MGKTIKQRLQENKKNGVVNNTNQRAGVVATVNQKPVTYKEGMKKNIVDRVNQRTQSIMQQTEQRNKMNMIQHIQSKIPRSQGK